jgi:hypothetical protein
MIYILIKSCDIFLKWNEWTLRWLRQEDKVFHDYLEKLNVFDILSKIKNPCDSFILDLYQE